VADRADSRVVVWLAGNSAPTRNITYGLSSPYSVFATSNGDIYVDNGNSNNRVDQWTLNGTNSSSAMYVQNACYGLFVDINNNLYCSMYIQHQVATKSLNSNSSMWIVAAGTDCSGSTSNQLYYPRGIFVDTNLNLYVADCGNNRVQKFLSGQLNAITVAGSTAIGTITLSCPSGVILDGNGYLFIVDSYNHRIVASGPNGFRCIVGCSTVAGSSSSQLDYPSDLKFDSYGNIFVTDRDNNRIQKFILMSNTTYRKYLFN
jgi:sugar lactone lactonase YvrE